MLEEVIGKVDKLCPHCGKTTVQEIIVVKDNNGYFVTVYFKCSECGGIID